MTTKPKEMTHLERELNCSGRRLREQAQAEEERWRLTHALDDRLRDKRQQKASARHKRQLERAEARRRKERRQQRLEREVLRVPVLVTKCDDPPRLIKQAPQSDEAVGYGTPPHNISRNPENRCEPDGTPIIYVTIREVPRRSVWPSTITNS